MDIDPVELCKLQAEIVGHRHRVARLLEDVDTLRRSVDQSGAANLTGRTGTVLDLCTSQIRASDAAMGQRAARLNAVRLLLAEGCRPRDQGVTDGNLGRND